MDLAEALELAAFNPLGHPWGQRGSIRVPYRERRECRWCATPCQGRRTSWCSERCARAYLLRSHWGVLRQFILKRDGRCCRLCSARGHEVDHVQAVSEGGTDDPVNLRLLCVPCHKRVTAEQAARWARARQEEKAAIAGQQRLEL